MTDTLKDKSFLTSLSSSAVKACGKCGLLQTTLVTLAVDTVAPLSKQINLI